MKRLFIFLVILLALETVTGWGTIINVPADYPTIQAGIDASADGDTVLVQPAIYRENINFNGHNIVVGSLFVTNQDTSSITSTIIEGELAGCTVVFNHGEDNRSAIIGFTISHARRVDGGGILSRNSSPRITWNIIKQNITNWVGGGILCDSSGAEISFNTISGNAGYACGGGIWCSSSHTLIAHNLIYNNTADP